MSIFLYENQKNKKGFNLSLPLAVQIEITEQCNFKCPFCYNNSGVSEKYDVQIDQMKRFLTNLNALGGVFLGVFSGGEPLIYKNELIELMDILHEDCTGMILITNGYFLDKKFVDKICKYDWYWIQISLDSSIPDIHDELRGVKGSYKRAVNAINLLKEAGLPVAISSVICNKNINNIEGIVEMAVELNVDCVLFSQVLPVGRTLVNSQLQLNYIQKLKYNKALKMVTKKYASKILIRSAQPFNRQKRKKNSVPYYSMLIRPNGDVKVECISETIVGNVFDTPVEKIWESIIRREVR